MVKVRILPAALAAENTAQAIAAKAADQTYKQLWLRLGVTCLFFLGNAKQKSLNR